MSTVIVSIQTDDIQKAAFLRGTCKAMTISEVTATVKTMLKDRAKHDIGKYRYSANTHSVRVSTCHLLG